MHPYAIELLLEEDEWQTSYVRVPPEEVVWRRVTFEIVPLAERMQIARAPCWEKDITFIVTSYNNHKERDKKPLKT